MAEDDAARENDAYRAIGRYVVEFSRLIFFMRLTIIRQLMVDNGRVVDGSVPELVLGEAYADQLTNAFFAICQHVADLDDEETGVATRLKTEVKKAIKDRNDLAHGDWWINESGPRLSRIKPGRKQGAEISKLLPVTEIDDRSDALRGLNLNPPMHPHGY